MTAKLRIVDESRRVRARTRAGTITSLGRAGAYIRGIARRSIAKRPKGKTSSPGRQPFTHTGALKNSIQFEVNKGLGTVAIGPTRTGIGKIGAIHEFGANVGAGKFRQEYRLGEVGPIALNAGLVRRARFLKGAVQWTELKTPAMVARSNSIAKFIPIGQGGLAGPNAGKYPPRPFMRPALERSRDRLPAFWRNSVRGN